MYFVIVAVSNLTYWITYLLFYEVLKVDTLSSAIIAAAATIFVGILGLIGVCIRNGIKSQKINNNLVKLQDCQIGVKDGELSIASQLGVKSGENVNLTAQHTALMEEQVKLKEILNTQIKVGIDNLVNESEQKKQKEDSLSDNEKILNESLKNISGFAELWLDQCKEIKQLQSKNKELNQIIKKQENEIRSLQNKIDRGFRQNDSHSLGR